MEQSPESLLALRTELGLDRPPTVRFFEWLWRAAHLDFGHSLANPRDVLEQRAPRALNTFFLASYAALVAVPLAVALGIAAAIGQGGTIPNSA